MMSLPTTIDDCWNRIGIAGDRSCPKLAEYVHCRNCTVFADAAQAFFDRIPPEEYLTEWTGVLARPDVHAETDCVSVLIFRLHGEWLALPAAFLAEVTEPRPAHRVPHRSNHVFVGLVNVRGQLLLCVSMHGVLSVEPVTTKDSKTNDNGETLSRQRLVVVEKEGERWAFSADEVFGVERIPRSQLRKVPGTLADSASGFSQAVFNWHDYHVGYLDDQRVLTAFRSLGT